MCSKQLELGTGLREPGGTRILVCGWMPTAKGPLLTLVDLMGARPRERCPGKATFLGYASGVLGGDLECVYICTSLAYLVKRAKRSCRCFPCPLCQLRYRKALWRHRDILVEHNREWSMPKGVIRGKGSCAD